MPDYKEMYLKLFRASEHAIHTMIAAQNECEEWYISQCEAELHAFPPEASSQKHIEDE